MIIQEAREQARPRRYRRARVRRFFGLCRCLCLGIFVENEKEMPFHVGSLGLDVVVFSVCSFTVPWTLKHDRNTKWTRRRRWDFFATDCARLIRGKSKLLFYLWMNRQKKQLKLTAWRCWRQSKADDDADWQKRRTQIQIQTVKYLRSRELDEVWRRPSIDESSGKISLESSQRLSSLMLSRWQFSLIPSCFNFSRLSSDEMAVRLKWIKLEGYQLLVLGRFCPRNQLTRNKDDLKLCTKQFQGSKGQQCS